MSQAYTTSVTTISVPPFDKNTGLMIGIGVAFLLGVHGAMRFYIGDTGIGLAQCITCGGCWVWSIIDWINYEQIIDDANRKRGWSGTTTVTTVQQTQPAVVYSNQPVVYAQQQPVVYAQQPQPVVYGQQPVVYAQPQQPPPYQ